MRALKNCLKAPFIAADEVLDLTLKREALGALKRRVDEMDSIVKAVESELISRLDQGASAPGGYGLIISEKEIRHVSWKTEFSALAGADATERALAKTEPTVYRSLTVRRVA